MVSMDVFASAFGFDAKSDDVWTTLGKVTAVSGNTLSVLLGGSATPMECESYCLAEVGDIVFVDISKGRARAIAVKGGGLVQIANKVDKTTMDVSFLIPSNATHLFQIGFVCKNANSSLNGHTLTLTVTSSGIFLWDNNTSETVWYK